MAFSGLTNTPLINYFFYKQTTVVSGNTTGVCFPITAIADGGNGQLVITTTDTSDLSAGVAITIEDTTSYNGNYTVISLTSTTFNVSGTFTGSEAGTWELASNITGAQAGDPLDFGVITFYDNDDQVTLQDTYSDRDLTVLNPNPLILDAIGSAPPIYLIDNPYYITIHDKFNNLVATLDNYLPVSSTDIPELTSNTLNLFPNYGFDTKFDENIYEDTSLPIDGETPVSAGWLWGITTSQSDAENFFEYNTVSAEGLIINPKNEVILRSTNNLGGKTVNRLFCPIGDYNILQESLLAFSIYTRAVSGSSTNLACNLVRTRNGTLETPINVGTIAISPTRSQETLSFTVPALTDDNYSNDDELQFEILLPLSADFAYGFTGSWLQRSDTGDLSITEAPGSLAAAQEFFGRSFRDLQKVPQYVSRGLPVAIGKGGATVLNETGTIFQAAAGSTFNYAVSMGTLDDDGPGVELLLNNPQELTQTNRLIDFLKSSAGTMDRSTHTFIVGPSANMFTISTGKGTAPNSPFVSLASPRITVVDTTEEFAGKIMAQATGNGQVIFTFVDNFNAATNFYNPPYVPTIVPTFPTDDLFSSGPHGSLTSPIITWIGNFEVENLTSPYYIYTANVGIDIISNGSGSEPAVVKIFFSANTATMFLRQKIVVDGGGGVNFFQEAERIIREGRYEGHLNDGVDRSFEIGATLHSVINVSNGYLSYNDIGNNPATQGAVPPRVIRFDTNGPVGSLSTITVDLGKEGLNNSPAQVAAQISDAVNTPFVKTVFINSTPNNGDIVQISNDVTDFNLIFWNTNLTQPANPDSRIPIYVQFTPSQTATDIALSAAQAVDRAVAGVPRAADLGLTFGDGLEYFMVL